jgi:hypothetical protein
METAQRQPARLSSYWRAWRGSPAQMGKASPSLAFAVIGQAKSDGQITPEEESDLLASLLTHWALQSTLATRAVTPPALAA